MKDQKLKVDMLVTSADTSANLGLVKTMGTLTRRKRRPYAESSKRCFHLNFATLFTTGLAISMTLFVAIMHGC
jgi:hypothetical protein